MIRRFVRFIDSRSGAAPFIKGTLRYLFPDHWSFLLGEVALYAFIVFYVSCVVTTWWFYSRRNAEIQC